MLSRSRIASAGMSRFAACATRSSGREAPSRKLNAERAWSSIIGPLHMPASFAVLKQAIQRAIIQGDIPLIAIPGIAGPPVAGGAPRSRCLENFSVDTGSGQPDRPVLAHFYVRGQGRPKPAERKLSRRARLMSRLLRRRTGREPERRRAMRVQQFGDAYVFLAYEAANAPQRQLQLRRFGRLGDEQTVLHAPWGNRSERDRDSSCRRVRRMRLQLHLHQLQKRLWIAHGHGQVNAAPIVAQRDGNFARSKAM